MYPYHNKIKQRIKNGELIGYRFVEDYQNIGECLLLEFNCPPFVRPIRPHKYSEYVDILVEWKRGNKYASNPQRNDGGAE